MNYNVTLSDSEGAQNNSVALVVIKMSMAFEDTTMVCKVRIAELR